MFNRFLNTAALGVIIILLVSTVIGCDSSGSGSDEFEIEIISPKDGDTLYVNVVKVSGKVSDNEATVLVGGSKASVSDNGSFYVYLDLPSGDNTIEALAIYGEEKVSQSININFTPAVLVSVGGYPSSNFIDYLRTPIVLSGSVNNPNAKVEIDGTLVEVNDNGSFLCEKQLQEGYNYFEVVAILGDTTDQDYYGEKVLPDGSMEITGIPGRGIENLPEMTCENTIDIELGEIKTLDIALDSGIGRVSDDYPKEYSYEVYWLDHERENCSMHPAFDYCKLPLPDGLNVIIEPNRFKVHYNTTYHSTITIRTTYKLEPGMYIIEFPFYGFRNSLKVNVAG